MATVKMKRGDRIAEIFDSPEAIAHAESEGFVRVDEKKVEKEPVKEPVKVEEEKEQEAAPAPRKRTSRQ